MLYEEERRAYVDGKQRVEIADSRLFDGRGFENTGIGNKNVEPIANDTKNLPRELVRSVRTSQIGGDSVGTPAALANLRNNVVSLFDAAAVMDKNLSPRPREGKRGDAADAT